MKEKFALVVKKTASVYLHYYDQLINVLLFSQEQTSLSKLEPEIIRLNNLLNAYFQFLSDKSDPNVKTYTLMNYTENPKHKKIIDKILTLKLKYPFLQVIGKSSPEEMVSVGGRKHISKKNRTMRKKRSIRKTKKLRSKKSKKKYG